MVKTPISGRIGIIAIVVTAVTAVTADIPPGTGRNSGSRTTQTRHHRRGLRCLVSVLAVLFLPVALPIVQAATVVAAPVFRCPVTADQSSVDLAAAQLSTRALPGVRYQCFNSGDGNAVLTGQLGEQHEQTMLLIHGLGASGHHDWQDVAPALAQRYHVLMVDLPGFGGSAPAASGYRFTAIATLLQQIVSRYAVGKTIVIGHSLGAAIALDFSHRQPALVERLVLVDAAGILQKQVFANHVTTLALQPIGLPPLDRALGALNRNVDTLKRRVLAWPDKLFDVTAWLSDNPALRSIVLTDNVMLDAAVGLVEADFSRAIRETRAPTTVLWGSHDSIAPIRTGQLLASRMAQARLYVIPAARHVPMRENPAEFLRVLGDALMLPVSAPALVPVADTGPRRNIDCRNEVASRYTGNIGVLTLENCQGVQIHDANIQQLILRHSSVELLKVEVLSADVAVTAERSQLLGTVVRFAGRIAVRSADSRFDLAGASLVGDKQLLQIDRQSEFYFSVSDGQTATQRRDYHEILSLPAGNY